MSLAEKPNPQVWRFLQRYSEMTGHKFDTKALAQITGFHPGSVKRCIANAKAEGDSNSGAAPVHGAVGKMPKTRGKKRSAISDIEDEDGEIGEPANKVVKGKGSAKRGKKAKVEENEAGDGEGGSDDAKLGNDNGAVNVEDEDEKA